MSLQVSTVVPTCGRPELLRRCLMALQRQRIDPASMEIIVVDDGWSDATRVLVERLAARAPHPALRYIRSGSRRGGPAAARNLGWRAARAPIIAFTDDDTVPAPTWLGAGLDALRPQDAALTGSVRVPLPPEPTDWQRNTAGLSEAEFVTANCLVRRAALEAVGGFDERFRRPWREDSDLHFALLESGCNIGHSEEAIVLHPARPAPWGVSIGTQKNNLFDALLYKKHPALYRSRIAAHAPWAYYAVTLAASLAAIGVLVGNAILMFFGLLSWLAWTLGFAMYRLRKTSRAPRHVAEMIATSAVIPIIAVFWRIVGAWRFRVAFA